MAKGKRIDSRKAVPKTKGGAAAQSLYRKEYDGIVQRLVRLTGATVTEIAETLGVTTQTIYYWQARHDSFRKALHIDLEVANHRVEVSIYQEAIGYWTEEIETKQLGNGKVLTTKKKVWNRPSGTAQVWWTKCKAGWTPEIVPDALPAPETQDGDQPIDRNFARRLAFLHQLELRANEDDNSH